MKARLVSAVVAAMAVPAMSIGQMAPPTAPAATQSALAGVWSGQIEVPGQRLAISVSLAQTETGWTGTIDIPAQGAKGLPLEAIAVEGDHVMFRIARIPGAPTFDGHAGGDGIAGTFSQAALKVPFKLTRGALKPATRPQDPVPPYPYRSEDVSVPVKPGVILAGTLTVPPGEGPFPAVVLVTGSGPQNRNEELLGHRPFLVLSDRLTRAGIAVLRCDDRGVAKSTGSFAMCTTADFADDAEAAWKFLAARPEAKKGAVGILGHSEGGLIGPIVAARNGEVAFVVMFAGPGVPGAALMEVQLQRGALAAGVPQALVEKLKEPQQRFLGAAATGNTERTRQALLDMTKLQLGPATRDAAAEQRMAAAIDTQMRQFTSAWFQYFLMYDPRMALRQVKCPVLALDGTLDVQVDAQQNLPEVGKALAEAGNKDVTLKELPGLNHLFQHATTGGGAEYEKIDETISEEVLALVPAWINKRFGKK